MITGSHLISQQGELAAAGGVVVVEYSGFAAAVGAPQLVEPPRRRGAAVTRGHVGQGGRHRDGGHRDAGPPRRRRLVVVGEGRGETGERKGRR